MQFMQALKTYFAGLYCLQIFGSTQGNAKGNRHS
jgi:hypothetical protein